MVRAFAPYHHEENITHGGSYITKEVHDKIEHVQYAEKYKVYEFHRLPPFRTSGYAQSSNENKNTMK